MNMVDKEILERFEKALNDNIIDSLGKTKILSIIKHYEMHHILSKLKEDTQSDKNDDSLF